MRLLLLLGSVLESPHPADLLGSAPPIFDVHLAEAEAGTPNPPWSTGPDSFLHRSTPPWTC